MKVRVPKSFELYGQTVKVRREPDSDFTSNCEFGNWSPSSLKISIRQGLNPDVEMQTFWHEWFHAAFDSAGYHKLSSDENLVDTMAGLLCQTFKSSRRK